MNAATSSKVLHSGENVDDPVVATRMSFGDHLDELRSCLIRALVGVALATVVTTWGSSPRPVGSQLAVDEAGQMIGSVSGGCIEGAVVTEGLRVIADFEWEFQMHHLNRTLAPEVETMYLIADSQYSFVSSSSVKEIASFGGNVDGLVPDAVARRFQQLFPSPKPGAPVSPQE